MSEATQLKVQTQKEGTITMLQFIGGIMRVGVYDRSGIYHEYQITARRLLNDLPQIQLQTESGEVFEDI